MLGIIALVLVLAGGAAQLWHAQSEGYQQFASACWRVGVVLAVLWLALPQMRQVRNRFLLAGLIATILVVAKWPKLILPALAALILFAILRPRVQSSRK